MSLEQLEKQIQVATLALERATKAGDKKLKGDIVKELESFRAVLEKSKVRLKELESMKRQCSDLSIVRQNRIGELSTEAEMKAKEEATKSKKPEEEKSYLKPIRIPWLHPRAKKEDKVKKVEKVEKEPPKDDRNDVEEGGMISLAMSFGNQIIANATDMASVSSLGSQIFGTSEITTAVKKENTKREEVVKSKRHDPSRPRIQEALRRNDEATRRMRAEEELRDQPLEVIPSNTGTFSGTASGVDEIVRSFTSTGADEIIRSFTSTDAGVSKPMLSAEQIAEQELKAREQYITATKKHQELRRSGLAEDSPEMKQSEKMLRDCYAQIEYWECLGEEASNQDNSSQTSGLRGNMFLGRDPLNTQPLDVDKETSKARDAYAYAMSRHQKLVTRKVCTSSPEWLNSQNRVNDALTNLQYWESRSAFAVPPSI